MKKFSNRQDFSRRTKAFTLIEMLVAISISALFIGGFVLIIGAIYTETDIRKPATKLEVLAQRVRTIATVHQRTYQIYFTQKGFYILPFGENPEEQPQTDWSVLADRDSEREPPLQHPTVREFHEIEDHITFLIKGWGGDKFRILDGEFSYAWQFEPSGMTEPITVRFELKDSGEQTSWLQQTYHPMTATVSEEESAIYN